MGCAQEVQDGLVTTCYHFWGVSFHLLSFIIIVQLGTSEIFLTERLSTGMKITRLLTIFINTQLLIRLEY